MKLNSFFNIFGEKMKSMLGNSDAYSELFLRFIEKDDYYKAQEMINNDFKLTSKVKNKLDEILITNICHLLMNKNFHYLVKDESSFLKSENVMNNTKFFRYLSFVVENNLLTIDTLMKTQDTSLFFQKDRMIKNNIMENHKEKGYANNALKEIPKRIPDFLTKLKNEYKSVELKSNQTFNTFDKTSLFNSSFSFYNSIKYSSENEYLKKDNPLLDLNNFLFHIPLNRIFRIYNNSSNSEVINEKLEELVKEYKTKFNLNENQEEQLLNIVNSKYLTNILITASIPSVIIKNEVENGAIPEDIFMKIYNKSVDKNKEIENYSFFTLLFTVIQLYPEVSSKINKKLINFVLENMDIFLKNKSYEKESISKDVYQYIDVLKERKDSHTVEYQRDEELLNNFLKDKKKKTIEDNDYIKLAKTFNVDIEILDKLINIQLLSKQYNKELLKIEDYKSTENNHYIEQIPENINKLLLHYSQLKELKVTEDIDKIFNKMLNECALKITERLDSIGQYIYSEQLKLLNNNNKQVRAKIG